MITRHSSPLTKRGILELAAITGQATANRRREELTGHDICDTSTNSGVLDDLVFAKLNDDVIVLVLEARSCFVCGHLRLIA
jgi:hypothetical protein